jgi:hypothetical protein
MAGVGIFVLLFLPASLATNAQNRTSIPASLLTNGTFTTVAGEPARLSNGFH